jgi:hypothetical protein
VENEDILHVFTSLNPTMGIPDRRNLTNFVDHLHTECTEFLKKHIKLARGRIALTGDIWSKKGMSNSFMGVTAHYVNDNFEIEECALDLIEFEHPHTGDRISKNMDDVQKKWDFIAWVIITDNGGNMVKAFKEVTHIIQEGCARVNGIYQYIFRNINVPT